MAGDVGAMMTVGATMTMTASDVAGADVVTAATDRPFVPCDGRSLIHYGRGAVSVC
jgi:hypothetical protein